MTGHEVAQYAKPDRRPLSEEEWGCVMMMRSVTGGRLPTVTFKLAQKLQILLREGAG